MNSSPKPSSRRVLPDQEAAQQPGLTTPFRCGTVAIVGRPNVGKSTLLNRLVGQKLSITSRKPQTTRHRITGILTDPVSQFVFVDTPGYQTRHGSALNRNMNKSVRVALADVDVVLLVVEANRYSAEDQRVVDLLPRDSAVVLSINKTELLDQRAALLPFIAARASEFQYAALVPVSAKTGLGADQLLEALRLHLPEQPAIFGADELTDRSERFLVAELIREKVFRLVGDELPYGSTVMIDQYLEEPSASGGRFVRIAATILVDRAGHKSMVIGRGGEKLKQIGTDARVDIERLLDAKTHLELWVKVKSGWADDQASLKSYGYD
jgi:GTP-binding protein Era